MPTVRDILNQCQYGKDIVEAKENKKNILESRDEETGLFLVSQRILDLSSKIFMEDCSFSKPIQRMITKFSSVEERIKDGKKLSPAYKKMQALSIKEDYDSIINLISDRKEYNKINDKRSLGKIVAAAKHGMKEINESAVFTESENTLFNSYIKEELAFIGDVL